MDGRTIVSGSPNSADSCSATRSPRALVNVYTSGQPSVWARALPYSVSRLFTQFARRSSASADTAIGPARRCSFRARSTKRSSISGRREAASTALREASAASASSFQSTRCSRGFSGITPLVIPATYAVETCTKWGRLPLDLTASYRCRAPRTFAWKAWSTGGSKETEAAQWKTTSRSPGRSGAPSATSPSTRAMRSAWMRWIPSAPMRARRGRKALLESTSSMRDWGGLP